MAIVSARYRSNCLNRFVTFTAVLPFEQNGGEFLTSREDAFSSFPPMKTLYLLHGITGDEVDWLYGTRIASYAEERGIAVIMPDGGNSFYHDHYYAEKWGEFVGKELVQVSRRMFRLSEKREDTYIGGLSMGGYGAMRNGLKYSHTFSKILSLSGAFVTLDLPAKEYGTDWLETKEFYEQTFGDLDRIKGSDLDLEQLYLDHGKDTEIFMAVGTEDFLLEKNRRYRDFLEAHGAKLRYMEEPGAHEWDFWDRNIKRGLDWLLEKQEKEKERRKEL